MKSRPCSAACGGAATSPTQPAYRARGQACRQEPRSRAAPRRVASRTDDRVATRRQARQLGRTSGDECSIGGGRGSGGGDGHRARGRARVTDGTVAPGTGGGTGLGLAVLGVAIFEVSCIKRSRVELDSMQKHLMQKRRQLASGARAAACGRPGPPGRSPGPPESANSRGDFEVRCKRALLNSRLTAAPLLSRLRRRCAPLHGACGATRRLRRRDDHFSPTWKNCRGRRCFGGGLAPRTSAGRAGPVLDRAGSGRMRGG